jgi:hypothetical protein
VGQEGDVLLARVQIPHGEALRSVRPSPHAIDTAGAGLDPDEMLPQAADLVLDLLRGPVSDGHTAHKRPRPDTDPEHTEGTAPRMTRERVQGDGQDERKAHR